MATKNQHQGAVTISRPSYGGDRSRILIQVRDSKSGETFVETLVNLADFSSALTGLSEVPCEFNTRALDKIGKVKETKVLVFSVSGNRDVQEATTTAEALCPFGWDVYTHFNSQGSFFTKDGKHYARTTCYRWV